MARPTTKDSLIEIANLRFAALWQHINSLTEVEQNCHFNFAGKHGAKEAHWQRDKNLRDVLIHLYEWHLLLINWIKANQQGEAKPFLPPPYNWKTYAEMNIQFWQKHQTTPYDQAKHLLLHSHKQVLDLISQFNNDELFEKQHFNWTGTTSLGSFCVSSTCSHYDWAIKKIKLHQKTIQRSETSQ